MNAAQTTARPLAFGYLRLLAQAPDEEDLGEIESGMRAFAEARGYRFVTTFHEYPGGALAGFEELMKALEKTGSRHVIVPTLGHISGHSLILNCLLGRLDDKDAEVITLNGE